MMGGVSELAVARVDEAVSLRDHWNDDFVISVRPPSNAAAAATATLTNATTTNATTTNATTRYSALWPDRPPLLLLGYALASQVDDMILRDVTFTVWSEQQLLDIVAGARRVRRRAAVQVQASSGAPSFGRGVFGSAR